MIWHEGPHPKQWCSLNDQGMDKNPEKKKDSKRAGSEMTGVVTAWVIIFIQMASEDEILL